MSTSKNRTAIAVNVGAWGAGIVAAAVLVYDLNRPQHWGGPGGHFTTPLVGALVAGGWLALITATLWWQRRVQVGREFELVYARVRRGLSARMSRRHLSDRRERGPK